MVKSMKAILPAAALHPVAQALEAVLRPELLLAVHKRLFSNECAHCKTAACDRMSATRAIDGRGFLPPAPNRLGCNHLPEPRPAGLRNSDRPSSSGIR